MAENCKTGGKESSKKRITLADAERLYKEYDTPPHVIRHCKAVAWCALTIARELNKHGYNLDLELVEGAGIVHDVARTSPRHWDVMADKLTEMGYPDESAIVRVHMEPGEYNDLAHITEADMVKLGDRLVKEDQYVGIDERFDYIIEKAKKYGALRFDEIMVNKQKMQVLLDEIEGAIGCTIDSLFGK